MLQLHHLIQYNRDNTTSESDYTLHQNNTKHKHWITFWIWQTKTKTKKKKKKQPIKFETGLRICGTLNNEKKKNHNLGSVKWNNAWIHVYIYKIKHRCEKRVTVCSVCKKLGFWGDLECGSETERLSIGGKRRRRVEAREEESGAT